MLRLILSGNHKLITSIVSKMTTKFFRKNLGCKSSKVTCKDIVIDTISEDKFMIHFNGDFELSKEEILRIMDKNLEG